MAQAIGGIQVSRLKRQDEDLLLLCMGALIANLCESLNLTKGMNTLQAYEGACLLVGKYYFLKFEEFIFIFKEGKMGRYGQLFNRIDIQILCEWCEKYLSSEDRAVHFERLNSQYKGREREEVSPENAAKLQEIYKSIAKPIEPAKRTINPNAYVEFLTDFKTKAEQLTISELKAWREVAKREKLQDVFQITETILNDYATGKRTYANQ